jgi:hypothetical protein
MMFKPLKRLGLILSLSKDEDIFSGFFSILLGEIEIPISKGERNPFVSSFLSKRTFCYTF